MSLCDKEEESNFMSLNGLPENWEIKSLDDVCTITMGTSPPSSTYNTDQNGMPFFQGKAEFTNLSPVPRKWCTSPERIAKPHDILLSVRAPVGTVNIADQKCCIGRGLAAIRFPNYKYLFFYLKSIGHELDEKGTGTTFRAISAGVLKETLIPYPPVDEQERIVAKIEELFSELDAGVESLKKAQAQLKTYRQAVLKSAFEGKLTNEHVTEGELPDGWVVRRLDGLGELRRGKSKHRPRNDKKLFGGNYPFIQTGEVKAAGHTVKDFEKTYSEIGLAQSKLWVKGTLCITIAANIAETAFLGFDGCFPDSVVGFTANTTKVIPEYVFYFFKGNQTRLESFAPATAQKNINLNTLENLMLPYCPIDEQQRIVEEIESRLSVCDKLEETIAASLKQSEALRQSILKQAFEGRLVSS